MTRIFSNGPRKDFVVNPLTKLLKTSSRAYLAAPYFTHADPLLNAVRAGKPIQLLVGLNAATSPDALKKVHGVSGLDVRYFTSRFHAKIYIFDDAALLGSSNLTDGGLQSNREATISLDESNDRDTVEEIRALFFELWKAGRVFTDDTLKAFASVHRALAANRPDPDREIERTIGRAEPPNINVESHHQSRERIFLEGLRQEVYEQYRPAFDEVASILNTQGFRRHDLAQLGSSIETNRFLNWLRLTYIIGDEAWQTAPLRSADERRVEVINFGREWMATDDNKVPDGYRGWLGNVRRVFGTPEALAAATKEDITVGLMSLHAFLEQLRFVQGGREALPTEFWQRNDGDVARVRRSLTHLLHGSGDFIQRLHDFLYEPSMKLGRFGRFCALELYGTIRPQECPPMNGRMAKALRFLGFKVHAT